MLNTIQNNGAGATYFTVEKDKLGWKAVVRRNKKIIKQRYALYRIEADSVRTILINEFWGNQLN